MLEEHLEVEEYLEVQERPPLQLLATAPEQLDNVHLEILDEEEEVMDDGTVRFTVPRVVSGIPIDPAELVHPDEDDDAVTNAPLVARNVEAILADVEAHGMRGDELLDVTFYLREQPLARLDVMEVLTPEARQAHRTLRSEQLQDIYAPIVDRLRQWDVEVTTTGDLTAMIATRIPVRHLPEVLYLPDWATAVAFEEVESLGYTGTEMQTALKTWRFYDNGIDGWTGTAAQRVTVGVIEASTTTIKIDDEDVTVPNTLNHQHRSFRVDGLSAGAERVLSRLQCLGSSACANETQGAGGYSRPRHGTVVTWILAGHHPFTNTRRGVARNSRVRYYRVSGSTGVANALAHAEANGVEVVNISMRVSCSGCNSEQQGWCNRSCDCGASAYIDATDAGLLIVAAAGNEGSAQVGATCTLIYPAFRAETVAVAATRSRTGTDYEDTLRRASSSYGPLRHSWVGTSAEFSTSGVDITAPGEVGQAPTQNSTTTFTLERRSGTSYAAPMVAGIAALQQNRLKVAGSSHATSTYRRMAYLLLGGDDTNFAGTGFSSPFVRTYGAGRIRSWAAYSGFDTSPRRSGGVSRTVAPGTETTVDVSSLQPFSTSFSELKIVAVWPEPDLDNTGYIRLRAYDMCPLYGGEVIIAANTSADLRKSLTLRGSQLHGRCIQIRVENPLSHPDASRRVRIVWRGHGGTLWN